MQRPEQFDPGSPVHILGWFLAEHLGDVMEVAMREWRIYDGGKPEPAAQLPEQKRTPQLLLPPHVER